MRKSLRPRRRARQCAPCRHMVTTVSLCSALLSRSRARLGALPPSLPHSRSDLLSLRGMCRTGGGHVAAGGKVPVVYPPARGHGDSPGIPGRQPWDGGGSGGCGNGVDSDSWARLLAGQRSLLRVLAQVSRSLLLLYRSLLTLFSSRLLRVLAQVRQCVCVLVVCGSEVLELVAWSGYGALTATSNTLTATSNARWFCLALHRRSCSLAEDGVFLMCS